jgi:thymidylate synthase (FAD)
VSNIEIIKVNNGYVRLVDHMGSDLTTVNSARVSYDKQSFEMTEKDEKLIKYLAKHGHTSPFRHSMLQFEVYAPLLIARQWWKHCIGSAHQDPMTAWNESSRRYVTEEPEFYIPNPTQWRLKPENSKQGSGGELWLQDPELAKKATGALKEYIEKGVDAYEKAMEIGIAPEQARLFLPAYALMVRWYWTVSVQGACHFLELRLGKEAQLEIQDFAKAVYTLSKQYFPVSVKELLENE